ncbi:LysR family transcriptional regulator [Micrococcus terreus]|uniref:LysR family transcriptional regulator n=1 Tax=Micrococcus terreus TaxID=574650 RepID=UPI0033DB765F
MFTLDQIRCFVAVAEELHFGRAAERLRMTQPPLSRQIQKLERSLDVVLLHRDPRGVQLTAAGQAFLGEARSLMASTQRAPAIAKAIAAGQAGVVRIGFTAAAGFGLLGELLTTIEHHLPKVTLELSEMVTREQTHALDEGSLDLGLARLPFASDAYDSRLLLAEDLVLAVPAGHRLASTVRPVDVRSLSGVPLVMHSPLTARYFYDLIVGLVRLDHQNVVHTVGQITTMVSLVKAGRGVALVPESARGLRIEGVRYLQLDDSASGVVTLHAIWKRDNDNPALSRVVSLLS